MSADTTVNKQTEQVLANLGSTEEPEVNLPLFPEQIIKGLAREFVDLYSPTTECPPEFLWSSFMTITGVALSSFVEWDNDLGIQPRLFTVNIGPSADGRKSTGARLTTALWLQVLHEMDRSDSETPRLVKGFGSIEGMMAQLKLRFTKVKGTDDKYVPEYPPPTTFYVDELDPIIKRSEMSGSIGTSAIHQLLDANDFDYPLKKETLKVRRAYMGVIANCTTPRFRELCNRAMIVGGKRRKIMSNPPSACEGSRQALVSRIHDLIDTIEPKAQENGGKIRIRFASLEAAERWDWYYTVISKKSHPILRRIDFIGYRLMMIQALVKSELVINVETVEEIITFLNYQIATRQELQPNRGRTPIARIQTRILRQYKRPEDSWSKRDLQRSTKSGDDSVDEWNQAFDGLTKNNTLTRDATVTTANQFRRVEW
ncbi:MAG: hypothetical protein DMG16_27045 [Acidobacteria bacterium]|nr:MAG: hypothetical protein DMG16_27045 [Acidobacteriota bacterium]